MRISWLIWAALWITTAHAQTPDAGLTFEVAAVKAAPLQGQGFFRVNVQGGPGTGDPERFTVSGMPLIALLTLVSRAARRPLHELSVAGDPA